MKDKNQPKRILFVENAIGYGGAIICLRHLVRSLDKSKFTPLVVTTLTGKDYKEISNEALWRHIKDVRIDFSKIQKFVNGSPFIKKIPGLNFIFNQCLSRLDDVINFIPFFCQLFLLVLTFKPCLIHANNEPLCNRGAIIIGKILNIPVICHVRGGLGESKMMKLMYKLPDHFIPVSQWVSEVIGGFGVPLEKRTVVYDGIELDKLKVDSNNNSFRSKFGLTNNDFVVGLVGLLIPWKGQNLFIDAAKMLKSKIPNLHMMIIGGTPEECEDYESDLKKKVEQEGLEQIITFTGHVSDMPAVYTQLDVVVSASTSPEPLGTMVIECMALGRPLIAPDHGGAAEMTEHKKTSLLFKPGDAQRLADQIFQLYKKPEMGVLLGNAARNKAFKTFSVENHLRNMISVYQKVSKNF